MPYVDLYVNRDVPRVYEAFINMSRAANSHPDPRVKAILRREVRVNLSNYRRGLERIERRTSARLGKEMRRRLNSTRVRPRATGQLGNALLVASNPIQMSQPTGTIGIGNKDVLDRVVNRRGAYGTYWRAQEYGTGGAGGVPSQIGRGKGGYIYGGFYNRGGGPFRPSQSEFRVHPFFITGTRYRMQIRRDIRSRSFIRNTARDNAGYWLSEMQAVESAVIARLRSVRL